MREQRPPSVTIVGAGIAGMTAAFYLLRAGFRVHLLEKATLPGGRLGGVMHKGVYHEHAYHFFARWCVNFWRLLEDLGFDHDRWVEKRPRHGFLHSIASSGGLNAQDRFRYLTNLGSKLWFWNNVYSGVMPWYDMIIYIYSMLDLIAENFDRDEERRTFLSRISVNGFMASRPYITESSALFHNNVLVRAFALPSYRTSARTYRTFLKYAITDEHPELLALRGDSQEAIFGPFLKRLHELGAQRAEGGRPAFHYRPGVLMKRLQLRSSDAGSVRVDGIVVSDSSRPGSERLEPVDTLILAIPAQALSAVIAPEALVEKEAPSLSGLRRLEVQQIPSLDLRFKIKLPGIPKEHITLVDPSPDPAALPYRAPEKRFSSRYSISFLDNAQLWTKAHEGPTMLSVSATDTESLEALTPEEARDFIVGELRKYVAFSDDQVDWSASLFQRHDDEPLMLNTVGSWDYRPESRTEIRNLFVAGDLCRTDFDIVSVESAVESAVRTANAIWRDAIDRGTPLAPVPDPLKPPPPNYDRVLSDRLLLRPWLEIARKAAAASPVTP